MEVKNLKLLATSDEGLRVIAAHLQDAIVSVKDIANLKKNRIFLIQLIDLCGKMLKKGFLERIRE
jgi:predicted transcriptional regulator of viral defense system